MLKLKTASTIKTFDDNLNKMHLRGTIFFIHDNRKGVWFLIFESINFL